MLVSDEKSSSVRTTIHVQAQTRLATIAAVASACERRRETARAKAPAATKPRSVQRKPPGHCAKTNTNARKTAVGMRSLSRLSRRAIAYTVHARKNAATSHR